MNADQVIEGIGKAVEAAKPAQEYCLFWSDYWWWMCMTKSEWSGWAQAIGVFIALLLPLISSLRKKRASKKIYLRYIERYEGNILEARRILFELKRVNGVSIEIDAAIDAACDCCKFFESSQAQVKIQALNINELLHDQLLTFFPLINEYREFISDIKLNYLILKNPDKYSAQDQERVKVEGWTKNGVRLASIKMLDDLEIEKWLLELKRDVCL